MLDIIQRPEAATAQYSVGNCWCRLLSCPGAPVLPTSGLRAYLASVQHVEHMLCRQLLLSGKHLPCQIVHHLLVAVGQLP